MGAIQEILKANQIKEDAFEDALHQEIREMFLQRICSYMSANGEQYQEIRRIYYRTSDNVSATGKVVRKVCGRTLPNEDLIWLNQCIKAYFHKKPHRQPVSKANRIALCERQGGRCAICGGPVDADHCHVDHEVPWIYVGDELPENSQALCPECNWEKGGRVAQRLNHLFFKKKEGKLL